MVREQYSTSFPRWNIFISFQQEIIIVYVPAAFEKIICILLHFSHLPKSLLGKVKLCYINTSNYSYLFFSKSCVFCFLSLQNCDVGWIIAILFSMSRTRKLFCLLMLLVRLLKDRIVISLMKRRTKCRRLKIRFLVDQIISCPLSRRNDVCYREIIFLYY